MLHIAIPLHWLLHGYRGSPNVYTGHVVVMCGTTLLTYLNEQTGSGYDLYIYS